VEEHESRHFSPSLAVTHRDFLQVNLLQIPA